MPHEASLIATLLGGIVLAFLFGAIANRLRVSPLVGYLLAGIAVGWLIVEDLAMVVALVLLPALAGALGDGAGPPAARLAEGGLWLTLALTLGKVALFVAIMLVAGRRAIPWLLGRMALTGSRELFTLAVLATALGVAFAAAELFGASFALGAFFAGMVLSGSQLSHQAATETLPLRDAFAVLFFVAVGMLLDPAVLVSQPLAVLGVVLTIVLGKSLAAVLIVLAFGHPLGAALVIAASLAQIGEFSFILAGLGGSLGLLPSEGQDLIVAGAIVSIMLNPLMFALVGRWERRLEDRRARAALQAGEEPPATPVAFDLTDHAIVVGLGRVGRHAADILRARGVPFVVVERQRERVKAVAEEGESARVILGEAERPEILSASGVRQARALLVAIPDGYQAGRIVELARRLNPIIEVIARALSQEEAQHLRAQGAQTVLLAERELAERMAELLRARSPGRPGSAEPGAVGGTAGRAAR